ncbi:MAG: YbaK/EbsC family protein [Clostridia bacterium]|nr:YbaK/EbsC family protein [Clostridia bacterium]
MSIESVQKHFSEKGLDFKIVEFEESTATVELAALALGVEPARIAKTMAFRLKEKDILILSKGDARVDNRKYKDTFGEKAKMLKPDEVLEVTGHPVGGVCPFGLKNNLEIYLDISLKAFDSVFPAAGSRNSAVEMTPSQLEDVTGATWIDVC